MSQYFYLVSTLPLLSFEQDHTPSSIEFLELCRSQIEPEDLALLERARLAPDGAPIPVDLEFETLLDGQQTVRAWLNWESRLRDELVRLRAPKLETDASRFLSEAGYATGVYETAREAVSAASPLEAEELLDRARWRYLDELESGHFFDIAKLIIYYLKVQILERRALFSRERGEERFDAVYSAVMPESFSEEFGENNVESEE